MQITEGSAAVPANVVVDGVKGTRRKARFIVEVRYEIAPRFFDIRGNIIATTHQAIKDQFPHWQSDQGAVLFGESAQDPVNQFHIGSDRIAFRIEDAESVPVWASDADRYLGLALDVLGKEIRTVSRLGVRFIGVHVGRRTATFEQYAQSVRERFHKLPPDIDVDYVDSMAHLVHKNGQYRVGPVRRGEQWLRAAFRRPDAGTPGVGLGIDVDCCAFEIRHKMHADVLRAFRHVLELTLTTEEALVRQAGLLDD
jgi:hypothetical protein